ncbi:MAG TPA: endonuclease/exonuclease/phosphatase family protein, partial [Lachnospiraceae bacterium]
VKNLKKIAKTLGGILLSILLIGGIYLAYVVLSYHRIEDKRKLEIEVSGDEKVETKELQIQENYKIISYNVGFGAYTPDFSFFMDGGKSSWAKSKESVRQSISGAAQTIVEAKADFALLQEVDVGGTRSRHVNEYDLIKDTLGKPYNVFAMNYDSAFLMYPLLEPHGKNKSGIATVSDYPILESVRRKLPISTSFSKFLDLDRCYSVSRLPVANGKDLVLINVHMSAYGGSPQIRQGQISMLKEEMKQAYEDGNYVICGGDFNHDLKAKEGEIGDFEWAQPFPKSQLPSYVKFAIDDLSKEGQRNLWDTARDTKTPYREGETWTVTLDGFIYSDNIEVKKYDTINTGFQYSDHEPVFMEFSLK